MRDRVSLKPGEGRRAFHYLKILREPGATIGVGTNVGAWLHQEGMVSIVKWGRYGITARGLDFLLGKRLGNDRQAQLDLGGAGNLGELQAVVSAAKNGGNNRFRTRAGEAAAGAGKNFVRSRSDTARHEKSHQKAPARESS